MSTTDAVHELDARGLLCPIPVIRTQNRIQQLSPGEQLRVIASDPGALHDIPAWCRVHGHEILDAGDQDGLIVVQIRVAESDSALI